MQNPTLSLAPFGDPTLSSDDLLARLAWLRDVVRPRLNRFLGYYRNSTTELAAALPCADNTSFAVRPFRQYQELGLPARITGFRCSADGHAVATGSIDIQRKEVVIENDIGWRINTLVDFAAGRLPSITSTAKNPDTQRRLTQVIQSLLESTGGLALLQQIILEGCISGSAWIRICPTHELLQRLTSPVADPGGSGMAGGGDPQGGSGSAAGTSDPDTASNASPVTVGEESLTVARWLRLEIVDASRLCPLPHVGECVSSENGSGYAALLTDAAGPASRSSRNTAGILDRLRVWLGRPLALTTQAQDFSFDLFGPVHWQRYVAGQLVEEGSNPLGFVPFVRFESQPDPAAGTRVGPAGSGAIDTGFSDVEPLIGLQDELNTRLSDRAFRVTMTSFRMYLGRGIEDFTKRPVGPGQMWATDNTQATIETFGGDAASPSEDNHISDVREALDKISGVSPIAAGVIRSKLGNLTSAVALRLTLIALLARTDRKRAALNRTLSVVVRQVLMILDRAGIVASTPEDRGIDINWPTALPESDMDRLQEAQAKVALGVPLGIVLTELGYGEVKPRSSAAINTRDSSTHA
jgi:hypothetical protein